MKFWLKHSCWRFSEATVKHSQLLTHCNYMLTIQILWRDVSYMNSGTFELLILNIYLCYSSLEVMEPAWKEQYYIGTCLPFGLYSTHFLTISFPWSSIGFFSTDIICAISFITWKISLQLGLLTQMNTLII